MKSAYSVCSTAMFLLSMFWTLPASAQSVEMGSDASAAGKKEGNFGQFVRGMPENGRMILLRSYLPADGRDNVSLPSITVVKDGQRTTIPECPWRSTSSLDFSALEAEFSNDRFNIRGLVRTLAKIIMLKRNVVPPNCSWWAVVDNKTFNIAFPDSNATYWATPLLAEEGTVLEIEGEYGEMRYMSMVVYDQTFNYFEYSTDGEPCPVEDPTRCFGSYITDYQIDPEPGHINPFQNAQGSSAARYKISVTTMPETTPGNVLPSLVTRRGCLPAQDCNLAEESLGSSPAGRNLMPAPCNFDDSPSTCGGLLLPVAPPTDVQSGVVSNPDNAYITGIYEARDQIVPLSFEKPGKVFVIRGKLPRTPFGTKPVPWPNNSFDMRYWSICSAVYFEPYPTVESDHACVSDVDVNRTNEAGEPYSFGQYFTFVLSSVEARPIFDPNNSAEQEEAEWESRGLNWLQATSFSRGILLMRNMLPSEGFENAGQNVPRDGAWSSALTAMSDYYPVVAVHCTKSHFEENGWGSCFAPKINQR